ncbi:MAG: hypothetical protein ABIR78_08630 [Ferruginibacter sp.]
MNTSRTIKYKALFLLVSFSLNTVVGFACSLGIDMGFNSGHHEDHDEEQPDHSDEAQSGVQKDGHHGKHSLNHAHTVAYVENGPVITASEDEEGCCKNFVVGFQSLDKQLAQKSSFAKNKILITPFILHSTLLFKYIIYLQPIRIRPKIPDHSPPDIRVFIQSFLI